VSFEFFALGWRKGAVIEAWRPLMNARSTFGHAPSWSCGMPHCGVVAGDAPDRLRW